MEESVLPSSASKRTKILQDSERQLMKSGDYTSLRRLFAFFVLDE
jgi:hypothetical protein